MKPSGAYDYIIAGGGSAGCALAARLAEDPDVTVLLLEAGGDGKSLFIRMPAGNGFIFGNPEYDWGFESVPQAGLNGRRIYYPRGRGLGGSSLLNGMIHIRGNPLDYDRWRQHGLDGWSFAEVLPYFRRSEGAAHRDSVYRGTRGPLRVSPAGNLDRANEIFIEAARQAGAKLNDDFNGASQPGVGRFDSTVFDGRRQSSAAGYLSTQPGNLTCLTSCHVVGIEMEGKRARGVRARQGGTERLFRAEREVISCLGAFGSPQLLMLSGIGPADHLRSHGIGVTVDLPGVGESLQDHPNVPVTFEAVDDSLSLARFQRLDRAIMLALRYLISRDGPGAAPFWSTALFHALRDPDIPDLQVFFTPMIVKEEGGTGGFKLSDFPMLGNKILARGKRAAPGFQFDVNLLRPQGRGTVRLASPDPGDYPLIDPGYLKEPRDLRDLLAGVRHMRHLAEQPAFREVCGKEVLPGPGYRSDDEIAEGIRLHANTGHHPVSTCRMGRDEDRGAVLDKELRVRGTEGLRVVDASSFPDQIGANLNSTVIMLAEKAADLILGKLPLPPEHV